MYIKLKTYNENILVPRNIEERQEKLKQQKIKLLSQEVINGDLDIDDDTYSLSEELVKVKKVNGDIKVSTKMINKLPKWMSQIEVNGDFIISNSYLETLENSPHTVKDNFIAYNVHFLNSFENGSKSVGCYDLYNLKNVKSLKGIGHARQYLIEGLYNITSLEGLPEIPSILTLQIKNCENFVSLKGCPKIVKFFSCINTPIKSFKYGPIKCVNFAAHGNRQLVSLEGSPEYVQNTYDVSFSAITTMSGSPKIIGQNLYLVDCEKLKSLKDGPIAVGENISLSGCISLEDTEGIPVSYYYYDSHIPTNGKWKENLKNTIGGIPYWPVNKIEKDEWNAKYRKYLNQI